MHILYCCPITNQQIYPRNSSFHFEISDWLSERLTDLLNKMVVMPLKKPLPQNGDINTVLTRINDLFATFLGKWYNGFWLVVINFWFEAVFIRKRQWQTVIETSSFSSSRVSSSLPKWNNESLEFWKVDISDSENKSLLFWIQWTDPLRKIYCSFTFISTNRKREQIHLVSKLKAKTKIKPST